jgi:hypothetical protein
MRPQPVSKIANLLEKEALFIGLDNLAETGDVAIALHLTYGTFRRRFLAERGLAFGPRTPGTRRGRVRALADAGSLERFVNDFWSTTLLGTLHR